MDVHTADDGTRTLIADDRLAGRLAGAYVRWQVSRGWMIALFVFALLILIAAVALTALTGDPFAAVIGIAYALLVALVPLLSYTATARNVRRLYTVGEPLRLRVDDDAFWMSSPVGEGTTRLDRISHLYDRDPVVIIRLSRSQAMIVPRALFSDEDVAHIRSVVGA